MKKRKEILVKLCTKRTLREFFDVGHGCVNKALKGSTNSYLASCIRDKAIELGGVYSKEPDQADQEP